MSEQPRDWDKELAAIDRAMAKIPQGQPAAPAPVQPGAAPVRPGGLAPAARPSRGALAATWALVLLVVGVAAALPFWPYAHSCGFGLTLYLAAVGGTLLAAVWALRSTWEHRRGLGHSLSLLALLWLLVLAAAEVLPRIGYAAHPATWTCPAAPAQPQTTAPSSAQPQTTAPSSAQPQTTAPAQPQAGPPAATP